MTWPKADLILRDGPILTLDPARPTAEAMAIGAGRILAVGRTDAITPLATPTTRTISLHGKLAIPGLVDSHCHPDAEASKAGRWTSLADFIGGLDALLDLIAAFNRTAPPDRWSSAALFDETRFGNIYSTRDILDRIAPGRPVFIMRRDTHVGMANTAAFTAAGVDASTEHVETVGGQFTGLIRGRTVQAFVRAANAGLTMLDYVAGFPAVFGQIARNGITGIHNALTAGHAIAAYQHLARRSALPIRVAIMADGRDAALVASLTGARIGFGFGDASLRMLGIEFGFDGSTGGRTAAYATPYTPTSDDPDPSNGFLNLTADALAHHARAVRDAGLQFCLTGNGDRGIALALDAIEATAGDIPARIEHSCCIPPALQDRFARSGAIVSSAAAFLPYLGDSYLRQRPETDHPWFWPHRSMMQRGALVCAHSDAPVCDRNPFVTIGAMVTRRTSSGAIIAPGEALTREDALLHRQPGPSRRPANPTRPPNPRLSRRRHHHRPRHPDLPRRRNRPSRSPNDHRRRPGHLRTQSLT